MSFQHHGISPGRTVDQAATCRPHTKEPRARTQISPCKICGGTRTQDLPSSSVLLLSVITPALHTHSPTIDPNEYGN
jgi:hypothetical protein